MTPAEIANKEKIFDSAWKSVTDKFNMLNSWNVGADTGQGEFVKQVCMEAMEKYGTVVAIQARIQERKDHIYVLEQDLLDNGPEGEGIYEGQLYTSWDKPPN